MPRILDRAPVAVALALAVAVLAVLAMMPRTGVLSPVAVDPRDWFTPAQLARASDFRGPQLLLAVAGLLVEVAVLAWLVVRPPAVLARRRRHPVVASAVAGAAIAAALAVAGLPVGAAMHARAASVGLATGGWGRWAIDWAQGLAVAAVIAALLTAAGIALMRRLPRGWWAVAAGLTIVAVALFTFARPLVIDPLFNDFRELPPGPARQAVTELAARSGVDVGSVLVVDASRRTSAANAYVDGIGSSRRVVLYDTLLRDFPPAQARLVVAHELAHVRYDDIWRGLLFVALVTPAGFFAVSRLVRSWGPREEKPGPATVPALTAAAMLMIFLVTLVSNPLSRGVEARADSYSLALTGEAPAFIAQQRRLAVRNVSEPDPPALARLLFGTHPTTVQRIGIGLAWERGER
ncbi:MAG: M48 family metalloprotease [Acidobacteria bacterium]|nr:M48 family metalloprotease [Acidobacteriota bacterium]